MILALVVCVSAPCFAVEPVSASADVLSNLITTAPLITTGPVAGPAFPVVIVASASVVGWVGSGDVSEIYFEVAKELRKSLAVYRPVSYDVHNVADPSFVAMTTHCWGEPPERPKGIWDLIFAIIVDWIW